MKLEINIPEALRQRVAQLAARRGINGNLSYFVTALLHAAVIEAETDPRSMPARVLHDASAGGIPVHAYSQDDWP